MSIQAAYDSWSSTYDQDRNLTRDLDQSITKAAFTHLKFKNTLELGCGTGKNTLLLSQISEAVLALDFSEGMVERARQKLNSPNVEFRVADLTEYWPIKNDIYDLIVCNLVLEHIEDLSHIFKEAFRSLGTAGRFYISELHPFRQYQGGKARFQRGDQLTEVHAHVHHVSDFLQAAASSGFSLRTFHEYWHPDDHGKSPRLVVFMFDKP